MTDQEVQNYLGQTVVLEHESGQTVEGVFQRADPHVVQASKSSGIDAPYEILYRDDEGLHHFMTNAEQIESIQLVPR